MLACVPGSVKTCFLCTIAANVHTRLCGGLQVVPVSHLASLNIPGPVIKDSNRLVNAGLIRPHSVKRLSHNPPCLTPTTF